MNTKLVKRIKHQDIDFVKWDKAIYSSKIPFVFAQSFYLNATSPNWDALIIGDYDSVFPLTYKKQFGINYLPQPPFTSQLGAYGFIDSEIENAFHQYILKHYQLIEMELNVTNTLQSPFILPKNTYVIRYALGYKFNQNTKRNIAKALDLGFEVQSVSAKDRLALSQKHLNVFLEKDLKLSRSTILRMDALLTNSIESHTLHTFQVVDKTQQIKALAHFISNGKHTLYLKGTNFDKADQSGSMHLLLKHAIEVFSESSELFDFGGGSKAGLANFYKGLGGEVMTYSFLKVNTLPWLIKVIKNKM